MIPYKEVLPYWVKLKSLKYENGGIELACMDLG